MLFGYRNRIRRVKQRLIGFGSAVLVVGAVLYLVLVFPDDTRRILPKGDGLHVGPARPPGGPPAPDLQPRPEHAQHRFRGLGGLRPARPAAGLPARVGGGGRPAPERRANGPPAGGRRDGHGHGRGRGASTSSGRRSRRPCPERRVRSSRRGRSRGCATARPSSCRPMSSSRSTRARSASCPRSGWTSSTPTRARCCARPARTSPPTRSACASIPRWSPS